MEEQEIPRSDVAVPKRMRHLPLNKAGYVVPWFVAFVNGEPDFRVIRPEAIVGAIKERRCWVCGTRIVGVTSTFVIGPMCAVNRVSAEPPSHHECARYSAQVCPFLTNPKKRRREGNKPEHVNPAGDMIGRNPGVALLWTSRTWKPFRAHAGEDGILFDVGSPTRVEWWAEGRMPATRQEVLAAIESGLPILMKSAESEGADAVAHLNRLTERALELVPA